MTEELGDDFKLKTLWLKHQADEEAKKKAPPQSVAIFGRKPDELAIWALLAATAGSNDNIQKLLGVLLK